MSFRVEWNNIRKSVTRFVTFTLLSLIMGGIGGVLGAGFVKAIESVTNLRAQYAWILYLLPLCGVVIVALYKLCNTQGVGTTQVVESLQQQPPVSAKLFPAIFAATVLTHLGGGSAGREGAALQLGGSAASLLCKVFRLDETARKICIGCGMAAFFSALFGTPVGAAVFVLEVVGFRLLSALSLYASLISSLTAFYIAGLLGLSPERFSLSAVPKTGGTVLLQVTTVSVCGALMAILFCKTMHWGKKGFAKFFPNEYIRVLVGSLLVVGLTLLVGTYDYNGGGVNVIERIFHDGVYRPEGFILKLVFTALTLCSGGKGGEIIPVLFIGAGLGATVGDLIGLTPAFGAAVGMASMFGGVTNCPLASLLLCAEMFGGEGLLFYALAAGVSRALSGKTNLYE